MGKTISQMRELKPLAGLIPAPQPKRGPTAPAHVLGRASQEVPEASWRLNPGRGVSRELSGSLRDKDVGLHRTPTSLGLPQQAHRMPRGELS